MSGLVDVSDTEYEQDADEIEEEVELLTNKLDKHSSDYKTKLIERNRKLKIYGLEEGSSRERIKERILAENTRRYELNRKKERYRAIMRIINEMKVLQDEPCVNLGLREMLKNLPDTPISRALSKVIGARKYYNSVNKVFTETKATDIIVYTANQYIVCTDMESFNELLRNLLNNGLERIQLESIIRKMFIFVHTVDRDIVNLLQTILVSCFSEFITINNIIAMKCNSGTIVLTSIVETSSNIQEIINELQCQVSNISADGKKQEALNLTQNNVNIVNRKSLRINRTISWISKNIPTEIGLKEYYDIYKRYFSEKRHSYMNSRKFNELVENNGYLKKRFSQGFIWTCNSDDRKCSADNSECDLNISDDERGLVYLLHVPGNKKDILKLGMSNGRIGERIKGYGINTKVYRQVIVENPRAVEKLLISRFRIEFTLHHGNEWFKGDRLDMINTFDEVIKEYDIRDTEFNEID
jgi:hypothetical protein